METKKELSVNRLIHALEIAVDENLDHEISRGHTRKGRKYTYSFDQYFTLTVIQEPWDDNIEITVRLKDDKHEFDACAMKLKYNVRTDDSLIVWKTEGPWCKIVEKKVKHIEDLYDHKVKEEKEKEQKLMDHFSQLIPEITELQGEIQKVEPFSVLTKLMGGKIQGIITQQKMRIVYNGDKVEVNEYTYKYLKVYIEKQKEDNGYFAIEFKDGLFQKRVYLNLEKTKMDEGFWNRLLFCQLNELEKEIKQKEMEKEKKALAHFTRKYSR